eukprot:CAMPEP_0184980210 /NCGR_PEP_ID=MMETSP1098-20130426/10219_1 /TAXON_ID=89044 /ORGANISM="Spumella elongata, Strain CCAP 955/1" /LENGTH=318 /DNA_ID=CAMNT_0027503597 /DNA_START=1 /DNA_END=957 /DNA_ORIENTATION=-
MGLAMIPFVFALLVVICFSRADLLHKKPYTWVVVATFKNESTIISDWMRHYVLEGADHFYLIDNGSMDDYMTEIQLFPQEMITIVRDSSPPRLGLQDSLMKKYITQHIISDTHWVLVVDIDEYVYPSGPNACVADVLAAQPATVNRLWLPWKVFGSNGHLVQPTEGVPSGFTKRKAVEYSMTSSVLGFGKSFTRVKDKLHMMTHCSGNGDPILYYSNGSRILYGNEHSTTVLGEEDVKMQDLQLNHYMFQSRDYYQKIKCSRGGGQSGKISKYTMEFFDKHEPHANAVNDTGLMERYQLQDRAHKCISKFAKLGDPSR